MALRSAAGTIKEIFKKQNFPKDSVEKKNSRPFLQKASPFLTLLGAWLEIYPERGWYMNSRPKMGEWKRGRAWDWTEALTLKQMASKGMQDWTQV